MGDDQHAELRTAEALNELGHLAHCVDVEAGIDFVEDRDLGAGDGELVHLRTLLLASGEAVIDGPRPEAAPSEGVWRPHRPAPRIHWR